MYRQVLAQFHEPNITSIPRIGLSTFILHVRPKLRGSSDIRWKSTANKSELMQQQQDCKADVGVGDALLGGGKVGG